VGDFLCLVGYLIVVCCWEVVVDGWGWKMTRVRTIVFLSVRFSIRRDSVRWYTFLE